LKSFENEFLIKSLKIENENIKGFILK